jgi:radical SAM protein with 4Fe4S-binding SPASM domain
MNALNFMFEVTQSCNSNCKFCYNIWKENPQYPKGELSVLQIKALFDKFFVGVPTQSIFLSGGEPLLRDDLEDIVAYLKSKKLFVGVCSNGLLLTQERVKMLVDAGVDQFEVTLLSAKPDMHNELCGCATLFEHACEAISNILHYKVNMRIAFVATKLNIHSVGEVLDLSFKLGVKALAFYRFTPTGRGLINCSSLLPSQEQLNSALDTMDEKSAQLKIKINLGIPFEPCLVQKKPKNILFTYCQAGRRKLTIDSLGNLRLCEQDSRILGNLFRRNLAMLVLREKIKGVKTPLPDKCRRCDQKHLCRGGCKFLN